MRYVGQGYDICVPLPVDAAPDARDIARRYDESYVRLYGRTCLGVEREIVNVRVWARRKVIGLDALPYTPPAGSAPDGAGTRCAWAPGAGDGNAFSVLHRDAMRPGASVAAPCIIEEAESTTVLPYPGRATMDGEGNLHLYLEEHAR
jgi:N-methylhydantoinase A